MKKRLGVLSLIGLLILIGFNFNQVEAKTTSKKSNAASTFMIQPEIPTDNKAETGSGYFDIQLKSNESRTLGVRVFNPTSKKETLQVRVLDAMTRTNGNVDYIPGLVLDRHFLKTPGSDLVKYSKTVDVDSNKFQDVQVKVPKKKHLFTGTKAMALEITNQSVTKNGTVNNQTRYLVGMLLNGKKVKHPTKLDLGPKVPRIDLNHPKLKLMIQNKDPLFIKSAKVSMRLTNAHNELFPYKKTRDQMKIAPASEFYYVMPFAGRKLMPGMFKLDVHAKNEHYSENKTYYLQIHHNGDVNFISKAAYDRARDGVYWIIGGIVLLILIIGALYYRYRRRIKIGGHSHGKSI